MARKFDDEVAKIQATIANFSERCRALDNRLTGNPPEVLDAFDHAFIASLYSAIGVLGTGAAVTGLDRLRQAKAAVPLSAYETAAG
jgi:hypothetical protein